MNSRTSHSPAWLAGVYAQRKQRTAQLVAQSIKALKEEDKPVSLAAIVTLSKRLDPDGRGVSSSAILTNDETRAHYEAHRTWKRMRGRSRVAFNAPHPLALSIKPERDMNIAKHRLSKLTKREIINRLLATEQAYAHLRQKWMEAQNEILAHALAQKNSQKT